MQIGQIGGLSPNVKTAYSEQMVELKMDSYDHLETIAGVKYH